MILKKYDRCWLVFSTFLAAASPQHLAALSFPHFSLILNSNRIGGKGCYVADGYVGGGGGKIPRRNPRHCHDGDADGGDHMIAFNLTSHFWISTLPQESTQHNVSSNTGEVTADGDKEESTAILMSIATEYLRGGCSIPAKAKNSLDSLQKMLFPPFRMAVSALSKRIPAHPLKKNKDQLDESNLDQQQQLLLSTKIKSVSATDSDLLPQYFITKCAKEANLIGGTLTPETLESIANMINRQYSEHGYIMNSVIGATLVPSYDGGEGHVELKVREVKLAKPSDKNSSPVHIRLVEKANRVDVGDDDDSVISLPTQCDQPQPCYQTYKEVSGHTRPSKIARMVMLIPGSHICIFPDRWLQIATHPSSAMFGNVRNKQQKGKSKIFSTIHAIRPVPISPKGDTVELEIIATENKPYTSLEYGVTKSLYSDQWEGELDLKHANVFGGGEVMTLNARKGRGSSARTEDSGFKNWNKVVAGGPLSWRISLKDDYSCGSDAGCDLELFRDYLGVGRKRGRSCSTSENSEEDSGVKAKDALSNEEESPLRTGALMRLRIPQTSHPGFILSSISASVERFDPMASNNGVARCLASISADIGPWQHHWKLSSRSLSSSISATAAAGGRWNTSREPGKSGSVDARSKFPYATGTITSQQILPLSSGDELLPSIDLAMRHVLSSSSRHLPRHEAVLLGMSSRIRGYKDNNHQSSLVHQSQKVQKQQRSLFQSLKQLVQCSHGGQFWPPIALSKSILGTIEVRIPLERLPKQRFLGSGTVVVFGDWCAAQAQPPLPSLLSEEESKLNENSFRHSSMGIGLRKPVQGIPLKLDACITEHGTKGLFIGIGHDFGA